MAPQLLWHSLSPVILGQTLSFSVFSSLSFSPSSTWLGLDLLPVMLWGFWRTTSRQRFFFLRCNFVFGRLSVDSHYVSCGRGPPLGICQFVRADRILRWGWWKAGRIHKVEAESPWWCNFLHDKITIRTAIMDWSGIIITYTHTRLFDRLDSRLWEFWTH